MPKTTAKAKKAAPKKTQTKKGRRFIQVLIDYADAEFVLGVKGAKPIDPNSDTTKRAIKKALMGSSEPLIQLREQVLAWGKGDPSKLMGYLLGLHHALLYEAGAIEHYLVHSGLVPPQYIAESRGECFQAGNTNMCEKLEGTAALASNPDVFKALVEMMRAEKEKSPESEESGENKVIRLPVFSKKGQPDS